VEAGGLHDLFPAPTGTCGVVGAPPFGTEVSLDVNEILRSGRFVRGVVEGDSVPDLSLLHPDHSKNGERDEHADEEQHRQPVLGAIGTRYGHAFGILDARPRRARVTSRAVITAAEAVRHVRSGDTVMVGGFGLVGAPLTLVDALVEHSDATDLTIVSNNIGEPGRGLGKLLRQGRIRRGISSYFTSNPEAVAAVNAGEIEATLVPQGTFAEAIRAGGAGIGGFYTPVGAGTLLAEGKEERLIGGVRHVLEEPIRADVALVYAARADALGNLWYRRTARNFNPLMATAATITIAEAGEIVSVGALQPESVVTPHLYVDYLVQRT